MVGQRGGVESIVFDARSAIRANLARPERLELPTLRFEA
jgi:hypothetical protein